MARLGGDEFVVVLADIRDAEDAASAARTAIAALSPPYRIDDLELYALPSIGISLYPADGPTIGELIQRADLAMYHAKQTNPGQYQFVTAALDRQKGATLALEQQLRQALAQRTFRLVYQPILTLGRGDIVGVEALLRWRQSDGSEIPPARFLPVAESIGLIHDLGQWVFAEVCRQQHLWRKAGLPTINIAVNVSARQFRHQAFLSRLGQTLEAHGVAPSTVSLELSEAALLQDMPTARRILDDLHERGMRIALEDFGLGCSCLSEFDDLALDRLAIHRTLVQRLDRPRMPAIIETILDLGHRLQLEVTAVGIETTAQLGFLRHLGCDQVQGFHLGAPMSGDAFVAWYRAHIATLPVIAPHD